MDSVKFWFLCSIGLYDLTIGVTFPGWELLNWMDDCFWAAVFGWVKLKLFWADTSLVSFRNAGDWNFLGESTSSGLI